MISMQAPYRPRFVSASECTTCPPQRSRRSRVRVRGEVGAVGTDTSAPSTWSDYVLPAALAVGGGVLGFVAGGGALAAVGGALVGGVGGYVAQRSMSGGTSSGGGGGSGAGSAKLGGTIAPVHAGDSPANSGNTPLAGYASHPLFEWQYTVGSGDSAGSIALAIVGDDARYQELVAANHDLGTVGIPGMVGAEEWNFAPGTLVAGKTVLAIPMPWDGYIDQKMNARGSRTPFPEDLRPPMTGKVGGGGGRGRYAEQEEYEDDGGGGGGDGGDGEVIHYTAEEMIGQVRQRAAAAREGMAG